VKNISQDIINDMKKNYNNIDYDIVQEKEKKSKHDVIAHIHEF
jgi:adenylosuccinate lyase